VAAGLGPLRDELGLTDAGWSPVMVRGAQPVAAGSGEYAVGGVDGRGQLEDACAVIADAFGFPAAAAERAFGTRLISYPATDIWLARRGGQAAAAAITTRTGSSVGLVTRGPPPAELSWSPGGPRRPHHDVGSVAHGRLARLIWALRSTADDLCAELGITAGIDAESFGRCCDAYVNAYRQAARGNGVPMAPQPGGRPQRPGQGTGRLGDDHVMLIATILADHREARLASAEASSFCGGQAHSAPFSGTCSPTTRCATRRYLFRVEVRELRRLAVVAAG
jgi:hypothetical protein